jgi:hypothetical protein
VLSSNRTQRPTELSCRESLGRAPGVGPPRTGAESRARVVAGHLCLGRWRALQLPSHSVRIGSFQNPRLTPRADSEGQTMRPIHEYPVTIFESIAGPPAIALEDARHSPQARISGSLSAAHRQRHSPGGRGRRIFLCAFGMAYIGAREIRQTISLIAGERYSIASLKDITRRCGLQSSEPRCRNLCDSVPRQHIAWRAIKVFLEDEGELPNSTITARRRLSASC